MWIFGRTGMYAVMSVAVELSHGCYVQAMLTADIRATLKEHTAQLGPDDLIFVQARAQHVTGGMPMRRISHVGNFDAPCAL